DIPEVGGKNASLGEMLKNLTPLGVNIPDGFAVTAFAYNYFLENSLYKNLNLKSYIQNVLKGLNTKNIKDLNKRGKLIREAIEKAQFPKELENSIIEAYHNLEKKYYKNVDVAVRSSATAEDLPGASFAGQQETYLNIRGFKELLKAVKFAMASLFTDRAISYRTDKGFDHFKVSISIGVQKMVRSDIGASGVAFTLDTETGFKNVVLINGVWGLGEMIVQGKVIPDEFLVFKPLLDKAPNPIVFKKLGDKNQKMIYFEPKGISTKNTKVIKTTEKEKQTYVLSDEEVLILAKWCLLIERHYSSKHNKWTPMDIEWAKDGKTNELFIVQARPETIHSQRDFSKIFEYQLLEKGDVITKGISVGNKISSGKANVILNVSDISKFKKGDILVTDMTDPDWEPIMKIASGIITDKGGRTSHAAIVSRELGIPCIVGTENATRKIKTGNLLTIDTTSAEGLVYKGILKYKTIEHDVSNLRKPKTKIMMNIATPDTAFEKSFLPNDGVGLAREEFIIASDIGIHPNALINYKKLGLELRKKIDKKTFGYKDKVQFYIDYLAYGIAKIGAAFWPNPVIVRFSDFKTNEYKTLLGGEIYEPNEENPMIGWRGASRYYHPQFKDAFRLELLAIKKVREEIGLNNIDVMVPFCRTPEEGKKVLNLIEKEGLLSEEHIKKSGSKLNVYVMCEIPSNILLAEEFLNIFDGMSIGSNDLTQLTLGIDRDGNEMIKHIANENNEAIKKLIREIINKCKEKNKYIGICGQGPSDFPEFAEFLVEAGITSISLNPDTIIKTILNILEKEKQLNKN
ncbi:MAG: phosphoenolpyruvate synthase, partial [Patescibacteria group bacterium]|nr:phosphoenolpyruvate synthase [Patescibacteria group bacterium]